MHGIAAPTQTIVGHVDGTFCITAAVILNTAGAEGKASLTEPLSAESAASHRQRSVARPMLGIAREILIIVGHAASTGCIMTRHTLGIVG